MKTTFLQWLFLFPLFLAFTHLTLFLDRIFFPQYRQVQVKEPIFIIGNPRSGTSFLHCLLTQTKEFAAFETWQLLFPALTARTLLKPLIDYLIKKDLGILVPAQVGHELALDQVEHDEFLFFHQLDTQFVTALSPLGFDTREYPELRFHDKQPESRRCFSIRFLKSCLQRQIYYTQNEQVIAHLHFSIHRLKTLRETFPDAKFIYLVRSPYATISSHLSLNYNTLKHRKITQKISPNKLKLYLDRRYRYDIELYRYFSKLRQERVIPEDRLLILKYDELRSSLPNAFAKILAFTGIKPSDQLRQVVENQAQIQKNYKRQHKVMSLEEFDLTQEQIANDLSFVFEEYGFDKNQVPKAAV
ncbi:sulfotransferase [Pleurocapsa sp. PCC 7319]|uniref:sulfotransferase family protein n=1 Tax=Pleurocapsa sp. PCC 7319 TaxID=118161 RepID=UPI0003474CBB|nr:sulfotransferase [Pleurocapsa sp. PCC 7319]